MAEWLVERATPQYRVRTLRHRTDKPILRAHLAEMARRVYVGQGMGTRRGMAAPDMFVVRRRDKQ